MVIGLVTIFVIGYFCIAMEHPFKINKTATALMLGTLLWTVFVFCNAVAQPTSFSDMRKIILRLDSRNRHVIFLYQSIV